MRTEADANGLKAWVRHQADNHRVKERLGFYEGRPLKPGLVIETGLGAIVPHLLQEIFTEEDPPISMASDEMERGPIEIDGLLGMYLPDQRLIKIYLRSIEVVSRSIRVEAEDLQFVVRAHEYAHALVHLGTEYAPKEWDNFIADRLEFFSKVSEEAHEFLAQLIAWQPLDEGTRDVFLNLMARQSGKYQLSKDERAVPREAIRLVLEMLRLGAFEEVPKSGWRLDEILREALAQMARAERNASGPPPRAVTGGVPGSQLLRFAGGIPASDLPVMAEAIEAGCERVDRDQW